MYFPSGQQLLLTATMHYADYAVVKTAVFRCSSSWQQLSAAVVTAASALIAAALSEVTVASAIYVEVLQWWHVTAASAEVTATLLYMRGQLRQPSMLKWSTGYTCFICRDSCVRLSMLKCCRGDSCVICGYNCFICCISFRLLLQLLAQLGYSRCFCCSISC